MAKQNKTIGPFWLIILIKRFISKDKKIEMFTKRQIKYNENLMPCKIFVNNPQDEGNTFVQIFDCTKNLLRN